MTVLRPFGLFAVLCLQLALLAAPPGAAEDLPPDPSRLDADWWSFFTPKEDDAPDALGLRIEAAALRLRELREQFVVDEQTELTSLIDGVLNSVDRYRRFIDEPLPVPPIARVAQDTYTLDEITVLIEDLRKVGLKQAEEDQEIARLERAVAAGEDRLNQQKVEYRSMSDTSSKRVRRGLELMQSQLQLELGTLELAWRKANGKALDQQIENLRALVNTAAQRLTATDEGIAAADRRQVEAAKKGKALRRQLLAVQLAQSGTLALTPAEQANERLGNQRMVALDVQATREEVVAAQYALVERTLRRISADNSADPGPDRAYLRSYRDQLNATKSLLADWRGATARNRETALANITDEIYKEIEPVLEQRVKLADVTERDLRRLDEQLIGAAQFGDLLDSLLAQRESSVTRGMRFAEDLADLSWSRVLRLMSTSLFEIAGTPVTTIDILRMVIILTLAWWLSKLLSRALLGIAAKRNTVNDGSIYTLTRILHYVILAIGIMVALSSIGIDFTKFALFASALGVGIGFGLQTLVSNFVAGLIILFERSLKIGDFVELESGVTGEVREINMRSTLVTTNDNIDIVVPNSEFVNGQVTNWTMREAFRRVHIPFGVAYGTDKELVKKAALEAAANVPITLTKIKAREPQLWFVEFGDSSLNFELVVWLKPEAVKRPGAVNASYLWAIDDKLREYSIEVPFPQRDLHLRSVFGKHSEQGFRIVVDDAASEAP